MREAFDVRTLDSAQATHEAAGVLDEIWRGDRGAMPANVLRALEHAGNYVVGVYYDDRIIGAAVAFFGPPESRSLHSHIAGVLPEFQGRGVGRLLKEHQRRWALERGAEVITWTFDPLVARNAHFNMNVLGAEVAEYLVDHYGAMADGLNRGDASDRLLARWVMAEGRGERANPELIRARVAVPLDIARVRAEAPAEAARWRRQVRSDFLAHLDAGLRVVGFDSGAYLFDRP
ncbi:GNAT family N-acetyltransferase [Microbacterium enclense]|uniref:Predicted acetyltransferase, GNAT superfamily n=1 Tax=Microbacterium enclense TaxID=993073 RepID=A0A1G6ICW5_9MICO|nr:GNAT family N-acetyltransferase [Microbacterium enclense]KSU55017.1 hypothetical protein AS029_06090 [Microbacterium enclense]SDC04341.1 Predicted acetyltransferase, GNAT superfamily [Microbacterium enclense]